MKKRFLAIFIVLMLMVSLATTAFAYTPDECEEVITYDETTNIAEAAFIKALFTGHTASKVECAYGDENGVTALTFDGTVKVKFYNTYCNYLYLSKVGSSSHMLEVKDVGYTSEVTLTSGKYTIESIMDRGNYAAGDCLIITVGSKAYKEPQPIIATPTSSKVVVNGTEVSFDAYNINGNNYFKLRDIAKAINGTEKQFDVSWDGSKNAIDLNSNTAYTVVGGELAAGNGLQKTATICASDIYIHSMSQSLLAYTINGYNYFKLRDLGSAFDFGVSWVASSNMISIQTDVGYTE